MPPLLKIAGRVEDQVQNTCNCQIYPVYHGRRANLILARELQIVLYLNPNSNFDFSLQLYYIYIYIYIL